MKKKNLITSVEYIELKTLIISDNSEAIPDEVCSVAFTRINDMCKYMYMYSCC